MSVRCSCGSIVTIHDPLREKKVSHELWSNELIGTIHCRLSGVAVPFIALVRVLPHMHNIMVVVILKLDDA